MYNLGILRPDPIRGGCEDHFMKAAQLTGPKQFSVTDVDMPEMTDGRCLVRLENWSVCGSDIRHSYGPIHPEEHYPLVVGRPCHECAGTIVESRSDRFKEGQRVIVLPSRDGPGGLVEYLSGDPARMIALPDDGDLAGWLMCQPSGTVLYSCQQMGAILGQSVLILGQGSIGLSFTAICARSGAKHVIAVDVLDNRLEFSRRFGATHTINPSKEQLDEAVAEITGGRGVDIAVEAAGFPDTLEAVFRNVTKFGKVILFGVQAGLPGEKVPIDANLVYRSTPTVIPTVGATSGDAARHIEMMVDLRSRGWWDPGEMVTHRMSFDDVGKAFQTYEDHADNIVKVVMSNG